MKKYLALLLAGVMMLSLVACGEKQTTDDEQTGMVRFHRLSI